MLNVYQHAGQMMNPLEQSKTAGNKLSSMTLANSNPNNLQSKIIITPDTVNHHYMKQGDGMPQGAQM